MELLGDMESEFDTPEEKQRAFELYHKREAHKEEFFREFMKDMGAEELASLQKGCNNEEELLQCLHVWEHHYQLKKKHRAENTLAKQVSDGFDKELHWIDKEFGYKSDLYNEEQSHVVHDIEEEAAKDALYAKTHPLTVAKWVMFTVGTTAFMLWNFFGLCMLFGTFLWLRFRHLAPPMDRPLDSARLGMKTTMDFIYNKKSKEGKKAAS